MNILDVYCPRCGATSTLQWSRPETNVCWETTCRRAVRVAMAVCCAEVLFQPSFFWCVAKHVSCGRREYGLGREHAAYHGT